MTETETKNQTVKIGYQAEHSLLANFLHWYYGVAPKQIVRIWGGYLEACWHYFSVWLLLRTLLAPWRRDLTDYGRGFDFKRYLSVWLLNLVARFVGFVVRSVTIFIALLAQALIILAGISALTFWLLAPLILAYSLFTGINQFLF
jgi:hypothetical protein